MIHLTEYEIWNYIDGKLNVAEIEKVKEHLTVCDNCNYNLRINAAITRELIDFRFARLSSHFTTKVLSDLNIIRKNVKAPIILKVMFSLLAITFLLFIGFTVAYALQLAPPQSESTNISSYVTLFSRFIATIVFQIVGLFKFSGMKNYIILLGSLLLIGLIDLIASKFSMKRR